MSGAEGGRVRGLGGWQVIASGDAGASAPIDTVVIALVGERGREVREFLDDTLGEDRASAVAVVSTGDESPMMRRLAPKTAMAIAEYFRDRANRCC